MVLTSQESDVSFGHSAHLPQDGGANGHALTIIQGTLGDALEIGFDGVSLSVEALQEAHFWL